MTGFIYTLITSFKTLFPASSYSSISGSVWYAVYSVQYAVYSVHTAMRYAWWMTGFSYICSHCLPSNQVKLLRRCYGDKSLLYAYYIYR
jgi:hypothetical protein